MQNRCPPHINIFYHKPNNICIWQKKSKNTSLRAFAAFPPTSQPRSCTPNPFPFAPRTRFPVEPPKSFPRSKEVFSFSPFLYLYIRLSGCKSSLSSDDAFLYRSLTKFFRSRSAAVRPAESARTESQWQREGQIFCGIGGPGVQE